MKYTEKFLKMASMAAENVEAVHVDQVNKLLAAGAVALDIRDKEEHDAGHIQGSVNISRGKLEMIVEAKIPDLSTHILCYCNVFNRGVLSAASLKSMGYKNAKVIDGGFNAYRALSH